MATAAKVLDPILEIAGPNFKPVVAILLVAATWLIARFLGRLANARIPPIVPAFPVVGGLIKFMGGPIPLIRESYKRLGSVFTVNVLHLRITFLIGPEATTHFYKAPEDALSQKEVYQFNVPTFGPGVVFDVDYPIRMEQFRFFADALKITRLRTYVDQMVLEAEVSKNFRREENTTTHCVSRKRYSSQCA